MDLTNFGFTTTGKKKETKDEEDAKLRKKEYEAKRQRTYLPSWEEEFPGLKYFTSTDDDGNVDDSKPKVMKCQICNDYPVFADKSCSLYVGTSAFRKDTLTAHWKSGSHRRCEEQRKTDERKKLETTGSASSSSSGPLLSCVRKMEREQEDKRKKLINTVYFICKHEMPFADFPRLIELQEVNGLDMGNFYRSDNGCRRYAYSFGINF